MVLPVVPPSNDAAAGARSNGRGVHQHSNRPNLGGVSTVRGLRIPVATIVALVADGMSAQEIVAELPDLEPEDKPEALQYAADVLREPHVPPSPLS